MCTVCGCGQGETKIEGEAPAHEPGHEHTHADGDGTTHSHPHTDDHGHAHSHGPHYGLGPAHAHAPGLSQSRMVQIERDILGANNRYAAANRQRFRERGQFAVNLVSSPGSGKTTLLVETIRCLGDTTPLAVIEGDQQTRLDADRIRATGARALQINTGKGCHLDAHMVGHALDTLDLADDSLVLIENVGNLVCPAAFDLGEAHKVVILSVTEGEDKPLKYPDMFHAADLMILNKIDLLPHVHFDVAQCVEYAHRVNPNLVVMPISATTGEGLDAWIAWLRYGLEHAKAARLETVAVLKQRITELEA